jgi:endonuclease/exonuclease/phosphatase family metal-dependent hydrolase
MKIDDRRHVGVVHLRHKATGKSLMVVVTHLMTDSRDNCKTNVFSGEVRANELSTIRKLVQHERQERSCDAVLFTGDFNISLSDLQQDNELHVLCGHLRSSDEKREVLTGFEMQQSGVPECGVLNWPAERPLREAFEDVHKWGRGVGPEGVCSSFSTKRCNWIDFMFYSADSLELKAVSQNKTPPRHIPDSAHPSDHLPISAMFAFRSQ